MTKLKVSTFMKNEEVYTGSYAREHGRKPCLHSDFRIAAHNLPVVFQRELRPRGGPIPPRCESISQSASQYAGAQRCHRIAGDTRKELRKFLNEAHIECNKDSVVGRRPSNPNIEVIHRKDDDRKVEKIAPFLFGHHSPAIKHLTACVGKCIAKL